jgi:hypothetical protein
MDDPRLFPLPDEMSDPLTKAQPPLAELSALKTQQARALRDAIYIEMSAKESQEYEERRARIRAISTEWGVGRRHQ